MSETVVRRVVGAPRERVYEAVADVRTLAGTLQPAKTTARILDFDEESGTLRMEIRHAPGAEGIRRFSLRLLDSKENEWVLYGSAFETDDPLLAGDMTLRYTLEDAPGGTLVTVHHEGLPERISVADNEAGTASSLERLGMWLEVGGG